MATILITGGAGFIGSNTAEYFLNKGWRVIVFDNFSREGALRNRLWLESFDAPRLKIVEGDIRDFTTLRALVRRADAVIHLAAQVAVTTSVENPLHDFEVNALGTLNILEAIRRAAQYRRATPPLIFMSTNKVYGNIDTPIALTPTRYYFTRLRSGISEKTQLDFHSPYGCSKGAADQYVRDYARIYGLKTVVFRSSCIYGARQFGTEDQGWVAYLARKALLGEAFTVYGDGKQVRDVLYVSDLIRAFDAALKYIKCSKYISGEIFNIGGGLENTLSLLEFIEILRKKTQNPSVAYSFAEWRPGDQKVYVSDITKLKKTLGWKPFIPVEAGIDRLFNWLRSAECTEH